ncbi:peptidoglycan editing factor PgeF [Sulfurimonas sp.]
MKLLQSKLLQAYNTKLMHAFTDKRCGNLAFHVNDSKQSVLQNHKKLASLLSYDYNALLHMKQIHSDEVHIVYANDNFDDPPVCDALITNKVNKPLMVMVADCSPVLLYDPKQNVIAAAHAGRAGAFKNIVQNVINIFLNNYKSNIEDIIVVVGPSILECCYEVGAEIFEEAKNLNLEYAIEQKNKNYYLNISSILYSQLIDAGIAQKNIEISNICTRCHNDKYFSYRHDNQTGRFAGIICLKN